MASATSAAVISLSSGIAYAPLLQVRSVWLEWNDCNVLFDSNVYVLHSLVDVTKRCVLALKEENSLDNEREVQNASRHHLDAENVCRSAVKRQKSTPRGVYRGRGKIYKIYA